MQGTGSDASAGYHGYWVTDFTQIDPHLGTNADMKALIAAAHAKGMKVYFDIITNHTADVIDYEGGNHGYISKETEPYKAADDTVFDDAVVAGKPMCEGTQAAYPDCFPELSATSSFPYKPIFRSEADKTVKVPAWLNDPTMYHNRGDSTFAGESSGYGDFVGLDDLFTERADVVTGMEDIYKTWVDFGIDGFRIDTVKHVNMEFWQKFSPALLDHAKQTGNDDFFMFGEVFDGNPAYMSQYTTTGKLPATLDFGFQGAALGFAQGKATTGVRDLFAGDDYYTDTDSNAYELPTFLGNHDMGRVGAMLLGSDYDNADPAKRQNLLDRAELANSLMFLTRGNPVVYYGDEQGFTGPASGFDDKRARQDMFGTQTPIYQDDVVIGSACCAGDGCALLDHRAALPAHQDRSRRCVRPTRRSPTARRSTATPPTPPASTPSAASTRRPSASTSSPPTTRRPRSRRPSRPSRPARSSCRCSAARVTCAPTRRVASP